MSLALDEIKQRLDSNLRRVEGLVALSGQVDPPESGSTEGDILRAAVVFLHATFEDVVRSALMLRLPQASAKHWDMLQFVIVDPQDPKKQKLAPKISVSELAQFRGKSVDDVIQARIDAYLDKSNFNNMSDLAGAFVRMSLDKTIFHPYTDDLESLWKRRHWIVHQVDRGARPPTKETVGIWKSSVQRLCNDILTELAKP